MEEAEYYKNLCALQKKTLEDCWKFIHQMDRPKSLDDATPREWSLSSRLVYVERDNEALRGLCDEYREKIRALTN
jgi:hypothetical protein